MLYSRCVAPLVDGLFRGYNATVFAYGQTGEMPLLGPPLQSFTPCGSAALQGAARPLPWAASTSRVGGLTASSQRLSEPSLVASPRSGTMNAASVSASLRSTRYVKGASPHDRPSLMRGFLFTGRLSLNIMMNFILPCLGHPCRPIAPILPTAGGDQGPPGSRCRPPPRGHHPREPPGRGRQPVRGSGAGGPLHRRDGGGAGSGGGSGESIELGS
jgi:hypothetical protein